MSQVCPGPSPNPNLSQSQQVIYPSIISCFPQMKPEVSSQKLKVEVEQSAVAEEDIEMTDDEKMVFNILKDNSPIDLNDLKGQAGLSNKKWDKAIKGLTANKLAKVEKTDVGLFVSLL